MAPHTPAGVSRTSGSQGPAGLLRASSPEGSGFARAKASSDLCTPTQLASELPDMGSPYKYGTRRVFPRKFPFSVVYVARESEIYVLALAPFSRKPGYWRSRKSHD